MCVCTLLALCVFTRLDYRRDVIHALHSHTAPKLSLRVMKAKTVVLSSHTKKIGLSSRLKSACVRVCPKKKEIQFASFQMDPISADTETTLVYFSLL